MIVRCQSPEVIIILQISYYLNYARNMVRNFFEISAMFDYLAEKQLSRQQNSIARTYGCLHCDQGWLSSLCIKNS